MVSTQFTLWVLGRKKEMGDKSREKVLARKYHFDVM